MITFKPSKKTDKYFWTKHSLMKMQYYGLSQQRISRVIKSPQRIEEGIVEKTVAVMQPTSTRGVNDKKTWTSEIWAMYQLKGKGNLPNNQKQFRIISAWRYPGVSPKRDPIPQEILDEIASFKY
jgi:hypothetical protein